MNIEAKYLNIKWKNENEIEEVKENFLSEKLEYIDDNVYFLQLYTYTKIDNLYAQIAFQLDDDNIIPVILFNNGRKKELKKIIDPVTNKIWWVENNKWNKKGKYYESLFINHIGDAKIYFGDILVDINVKNISLSQEDVSIMLDDFKNELWKLIYSKNSYSNMKIKATTIGITEQYKKVLEEYLNNIDKILKQPKVILKEYFIKENIKKIAPTTKTFIEYISDPSKQYYTSKSKVENYDIPDNQYIYWTFDCIKYILSNNINYQKYIRVSTNKKISEFKNQMEEINEVLRSNKVQVNKDIFYRDTQLLINERDELLKKMTGDKSKLSQCNKYTIDIRYIGDNNGDKYFDTIMGNQKNNIVYRIYNEKLSKNLKNKNLGKYSIICEEPQLFSEKYSFINLSVPIYKDFQIIYSSIEQVKQIKVMNGIILKEGHFYKIKKIAIEKESSKQYIKFKCAIDMSFGGVKKLNKYCCYINIPIQYQDLCEKIKMMNEWFIINAEINYTIPYKISDIISIIPLSYNDKIEEYKIKAEEYEKNDWQRNIDLNSKQDREAVKYLKKESEIMKKNYQKMYNEYSKLLNENDLLKLSNKMLNLDKQFKRLKISPSSIFPNSMTFVQNYFYTNTFTMFKLLLNIQNIDIKQLSLIQYFEQNITVIDMPKLYERWCFIIVINILIQYYHFKPKENNWINILLENILSDKSKNTLVELINDELECNINIWYEKELVTKKCPDIILEIVYKNITPYQIILDSKFHEEADIKYLIRLLYYSKDYAGRKVSFFQEDKDYDAFYEYYFKDNNIHKKHIDDETDYYNKVFILHPDFNALSRERIVINNQKWGKYSYYGEGVLFDSKKEVEELRIKEYDDIMANHRYGAIVINPKNYSYQTMMQRFLGMCIQYYVYTISKKIPERWICLSCGNVNIETLEDRRKKVENNFMSASNIEISSDFKYKYCQYCNNILIYTNCFSCKVKLIKNGVFWTYHNNNEDSIYNIKCPNCNSFFTKEQSDKYYEMKQNKSTNYLRKF